MGVVPKSDELFLSMIYITSEKRGKGYGRQIMFFIERLANEKRCVKIALTVDKNNLSVDPNYNLLAL